VAYKTHAYARSSDFANSHGHESKLSKSKRPKKNSYQVMMSGCSSMEPKTADIQPFCPANHLGERKKSSGAREKTRQCMPTSNTIMWNIPESSCWVQVQILTIWVDYSTKTLPPPQQTVCCCLLRSKQWDGGSMTQDLFYTPTLMPSLQLLLNDCYLQF